VELAARVVTCDPLDESGHELLVRAMVGAGDGKGAAAQVARSSELLLRELGSAPSPALADALRSTSGARLPRTRSAVLAAIDVGLGAAQAGAYDRAVEVLRQAVEAAGDERDEIDARARTALGTVLVHGVRGSDEEAIALLHRGFQIGSERGLAQVAAQAAHELGVVETMRGHYPQMESWFAQAFELAGDDARLLAWNGLYAGFGRTDQAQYPRALAAFDQAIEHAAAAGELRAHAYVNAGQGRVHLLRGELGPARDKLEQACATARDLGWTSFLPLPQALLGEVDLLEGDLVAAADELEHSYAMACQVGDPCWESYALRGRGLLAAARGDDRRALELLVEGPAAARRLRDTHAWVEGFCLDALCGFAVARGLEEAEAWVAELDDFAGRHGMRELVARAALHWVALGRPGARRHAAALLEEIANPALDAQLSAALTP
jgi:tetratricopeptide (TPR) repeat protein